MEKIEPALIHSLGWITAKDDKWVRMHPNVTDRGDEESEIHGIGDITIPRSAIRKCKPLTVWAFS
jgi:hypothetical protein